MYRKTATLYVHIIQHPIFILGMKKYYYQLLISLFFYGLSFQIHAENLIGGTLDFTHKGGNNFNIKANIFVDKGAKATSPDLYVTSMKVQIYSKGANASLDVLKETITLLQISKVPDFPYDNIECASSTSISTTKIVYATDIVLNKSSYNNPLGYYLVWQDGPRNPPITNINATIGMTLYLEFPRLDTQDNSSPVFRLKKGVVACVNQTFPNIDLGADDADATDTRTYSLVNSFSGGGNTTISAKQNYLPGPRNSFSNTYQSVPYNAGFSATSPITGTGISLNSSTGLLTGTPTAVGKYLICVECKEFRGGLQIGVNRLDFEIIVENCMSPKPKIYLQGNNPTIHEPFINICDGSYRIIETADNPNFTYVWKKDNVIIPGANKSQYKVSYANFGKYTVTVTRTGSCAGTETSWDTDLLPRAGENVKLTTPDSTVCSNAVPIVLTIDQTSTGAALNSFGRRWYKDDVLIPTAILQSHPVLVSGKYKVIVTDFTPAPAGSQCTYEAFKEIIVTPTPTPTITNITGKTAVCQGEVVKLRIAPVETNVTYQWVRNSVDFSTTADLDVNSTGVYELRATSTINTDCEVYAPTAVNIAVNPNPTVTFDDITPVCTSKSAKVDLRNLVNPYDATLGKFTGTGVSGYEFDPSVSGYGSFPIKYDYKTAVGCPGSASKTAIVDLSPVVKLGNDITIFRGDTIRLKSVGSTGNNYVYEWTPATSLNSPNIPQPLANPDVTTEYVVKVTSVLGRCPATDKIIITVKSILKIPSAFTPNNDNTNDSWTILDNNREFNDYPNIEVKIFNRWGGEIFSSFGVQSYQNNPFDGIKDGQRLPAGTYFYVIKPSPDVPSLTGYVTIVR